MKSSDYAYDWQRQRIVHLPSGETRKLSPRQEQVYQALDASRDQVLTDQQLLDAIYGKYADLVVDNIRVTVHSIRKELGREVIETVGISRPAHGGPMRCGYIVRSP